MRRTFRILAVAAALAAALAPQTGLAEAVMLRDAAVVTGDVIRLGDLFSNTGKKAEVAVAYAPAPGKKAVFDARWLWRVSYAYGLGWQPLSLQDRAVVERDSQVIGTEAIEDALRNALLDRGADPDSEVELGNRALRLYVPGDAAATVEVQDVNLDERTGHFSAILAAPANDPRAQPIRVTGSILRLVEVPVLKDRLKSGSVIRNSDISWIRVRTDRLQRDVIVDASDLIGKSPKRNPRPGYPLRSVDVEQPLMVAKGAIVSIILKSGALSLTAKGTAMENGTKGSTIRVTNSRSGTVVDARVVGSDTVVVDMMAKIASKVE